VLFVSHGGMEATGERAWKDKLGTAAPGCLYISLMCNDVFSLSVLNLGVPPKSNSINIR
jgi:hypothetical protein